MRKHSRALRRRLRRLVSCGHWDSHSCLSISNVSPQAKLQNPKYSLFSSQPEWRKSRTAICRPPVLIPSQRPGFSLSVNSKVICVPVQAEAGLRLGCMLMISHSTRLSWILSSTFIFTSPCSAPGLCANTRPASVSVDVCGAHQLLSPSAVEIASYTFATGAFIHTW
jgi:hypothetical protein